MKEDLEYIYDSDEDKIDPRVRSFMTEVEKEITEKSREEQKLNIEKEVWTTSRSSTLLKFIKLINSFYPNSVSEERRLKNS